MTTVVFELSSFSTASLAITTVEARRAGRPRTGIGMPVPDATSVLPATLETLVPSVPSRYLLLKYLARFGLPFHPWS